MKKYFKGIAIFLGIFLIVAGVAYGQEIREKLEGIVTNNYYAPANVYQGVDANTINEGSDDVGLSDQSGGFVITKTVTDSDIATTTYRAGLDITNTVSGSLILDEMIVTNNATGLSTTTIGAQNECTGIAINVENGTTASSTAMTINDVFSMQGYEEIDFSSASSSQKVLLTNGDKLQVIPVGNYPCTSDGEITFTMFFKKVNERAFIYE